MLYVTPQDVADALGVSLKTVDRWIAAGRLPAPVRGTGPKGRPGHRRWPALELGQRLRSDGYAVPSAWQGVAA